MLTHFLNSCGRSGECWWLFLSAHSFPLCPYPLTRALAFTHPPTSPSLRHFYPACSAVLASVSAVSQRQSSGQARVPNQSSRVSSGIRVWRLAFSLVSSLIHSQGLDHHTHTHTKAVVIGSQGSSRICSRLYSHLCARSITLSYKARMCSFRNYTEGFSLFLT